METHVAPGPLTGQNHTQAPPASGGFARAFELAAAPLATDGASFVLSQFAQIEDLTELAESLSTASGLAVSARSLETSDVLFAARRGASVLIPLDTCWLVCVGRRLVRVTADGETVQRLSATRIKRYLVEDAHPALVLDRHLALESLSSEPNDPKQPLARLWPLIRMEGPELSALVLYAVVLGAASLAVPVAVQVLVNTIAFGSLLQPVVVLAAILFGVLSFAGIVQVLEWIAVEVLQRRLFVRLTEDFARRLPLFSYSLSSRKDTRELVNRFFEVVNLQKAAGRLVLDGLGLVLQTAVGLTLLALYHPVLLAFAATLVLALGLVVVLGRGATKTATSESSAKYAVGAWLENVAANPVVFKEPHAAAFAATRADFLTRKYLAARKDHYRRLLRQLCGGVGVQIASMTILLALGGWLVIEAELTLGQLVAAEIVVGTIAAGFTKLGKLFETCYDLFASLDKIGHVLDAPQVTANAAVSPDEVALGIQLGKNSEHAVDAGERVVLSGWPRAEATRLLEGLAGLAPWHAPIRVHGLRGDESLHRGHLRTHSHLARVGDIVDGTVLDNLRLVDASIDESRAWSALEAVGLSARFESLNDLLLGHGGTLLRSEQARLSLARLLLSQAPLLLVDRALEDAQFSSAERTRWLLALDTLQEQATVVIACQGTTPLGWRALEVPQGGEA